MEKLVGKKVRLRNRALGTTLVAYSDRKSIIHINIDGYKAKPEGSLWLIKRINSDKSELLFESVYGTVLAWSSDGEGTVLQKDRVIYGNTSGWTVINQLNGEGVVIRACDSQSYNDMQTFLRFTYLKDKLRPVTRSSGCSHVELRAGFPDSYCCWDLEVVETPTIISSQAVAAPNKRISSASASYHVNQMYVNYIYSNSKQGGKPATSFIFPNYNIESGRNVNEFGTQSVGDVNVQTHIV